MPLLRPNPLQVAVYKSNTPQAPGHNNSLNSNLSQVSWWSYLAAAHEICPFYVYHVYSFLMSDAGKHLVGRFDIRGARWREGRTRCDACKLLTLLGPGECRRTQSPHHPLSQCPKNLSEKREKRRQLLCRQLLPRVSHSPPVRLRTDLGNKITFAVMITDCKYVVII